MIKQIKTNVLIKNGIKIQLKKFKEVKINAF